MNMVLANGRALYINDGKSSPEEFGKTAEALQRTQPTVYFNVQRDTRV